MIRAGTLCRVLETGQCHCVGKVGQGIAACGPLRSGKAGTVLPCEVENGVRGMSHGSSGVPSDVGAALRAMGPATAREGLTNFFP